MSEHLFMKKIIKVIILNILGLIFLLTPLAGAIVSAIKKQWVFFILFIIMFFIMKYALSILENRFGIRSPSNPASPYHGSGLTIVAPWLRKKNEEKSMPESKSKATRDRGGQNR